MEKYEFLNGAHLKYIAMFTMLCDHFDKAIIFYYVNSGGSNALALVSDFLGVLGRFSFPIFAFLIVEGFFHTSSRKKYIIGMLIFGVISEIPFNLYFCGSFFQPLAQNIMWTFALALSTIWAIDVIRVKTKFWPVFAVVLTLAVAYGSELLGVDYGMYGIFVPVIFYLLYNKRLIALIISFLVMIKSIWSFPAFVMIAFYNGQRGKQYKWLNYWFYPVHLLVLGVARILIEI